jgi:hypothetical protein
MSQGMSLKGYRLLFIIKKIMRHLAKTAFVQQALADGTDLSVLKRRPTTRTYIGLFLILFSYAIGWPAVALLGFISLHLREPLIAVVGGPITYGLSHLVFLAGAYLAGIDYARAFLLWATRAAYEKMLGHQDYSPP